MREIRTIITPTDFSELSDAATRTAAMLAKQDDATLHLLHSIRLPVLHTSHDINIPEAIWEGLRNKARLQLAECKDELALSGVAHVNVILNDARQPAEAIEKAVQDTDADLVVMATHGRRGIKHAFLGSVTERTIRTSSVPVLAVKGAGLHEGKIGRILLATDFSSHARQAAELAGAFAARFGSQLDVVHALETVPDYLMYQSGEGLLFEERARQFAAESLEIMCGAFAKQGLAFKSHLIDGFAGEVIAEKAESLGSDLIVMGTHGLTGLAHVVIGSVTERTMRLAPCSILTTRATEDDDANPE